MKEGELCQGFKAKELQRRLYLPFTMLFAGELFVNRPEARNWLIFDHMAVLPGSKIKCAKTGQFRVLSEHSINITTKNADAITANLSILSQLHVSVITDDYIHIAICPSPSWKSQDLSLHGKQFLYKAAQKGLKLISR